MRNLQGRFCAAKGNLTRCFALLKNIEMVLGIVEAIALVSHDTVFIYSRSCIDL